ncbi:deoxyuridine 5'-triphosphate nucleotidohydrolase [Ignavigranum ruoffiae]|uniref:dUTP diphosphatase n=1 Tax=Ignavigranum ruoffiae TaxID=89093 RepID=A0A1H9C1W9_9LACT|nr:deoxyuridine 5'-triphosphate nucleotidohydrolase [Ignavigranum ruoffiae]
MMQKIRGFEIVTAFKSKDIQLPYRSTHHAAGYDIQAAETIIIPSYWEQLFKYFWAKINKTADVEHKFDEEIFKASLVPTGLKAYMQEDEYLQIINRSSNPLKRFLTLPNSVGIIDADYYNNSKNEGHIFVQLINYGLKDWEIKKGDRIAQAIFTKYLKVDGDQGGLSQREGGFGSSGR